MSKNLIENEDYQIVTPSNNGLFTVSTLNIESPSNSGLLEDFQNVDNIPQLPFSTNSCFDGNNLPKIETLDSLLSHLCELMIRFDGCVKDYQKSDFEHLVKTVTNSLIYLYSNNTTNTGSFVVGFMGIANKDTNPYLEAIAANNKYPGIYFAQEFGNYPHFGVDVTNNELFNSIVLLIPNINSSGVVLNYEKSIYNLQISNSYFKYSSDMPRQEWVIQHNLNKKPSVVITDTAGSLYEGDVFYNDDNNLTITFSAPFNGYADLN